MTVIGVPPPEGPPPPPHPGDGTGTGCGECQDGNGGATTEEPTEEEEDGNAAGGSEDDNEPDEEWDSAANVKAGCIYGAVPDLSDIPDDKWKIKWETVPGDKLARTYVDSDGDYVIGLDYNKHYAETVGPRARLRDDLLYETISHELVHLWKLARSNGADSWAGHGSIFFSKLDSFRVWSRACD